VSRVDVRELGVDQVAHLALRRLEPCAQQLVDRLDDARAQPRPPRERAELGARARSDRAQLAGASE